VSVCEEPDLERLKSGRGSPQGRTFHTRGRPLATDPERAHRLTAPAFDRENSGAYRVRGALSSVWTAERTSQIAAQRKPARPCRSRRRCRSGRLAARRRSGHGPRLRDLLPFSGHEKADQHWDARGNENVGSIPTVSTLTVRRSASRDGSRSSSSGQVSVPVRRGHAENSPEAGRADGTGDTSGAGPRNPRVRLGDAQRRIPARTRSQLPEAMPSRSASERPAPDSRAAGAPASTGA
jgi:hypothetical protein